MNSPGGSTGVPQSGVHKKQGVFGRFLTNHKNRINALFNTKVDSGVHMTHEHWIKPTVPSHMRKVPPGYEAQMGEGGSLVFRRVSRCRGTLLIRNSFLLEPYSTTMSRVIWWS